MCRDAERCNTSACRFASLLLCRVVLGLVKLGVSEVMHRVQGVPARRDKLCPPDRQVVTFHDRPQSPSAGSAATGESMSPAA